MFCSSQRKESSRYQYEPPEMCCQVMLFGRGRETESETNSTRLRVDALCGPSCSPCQTWGCWWSWRGAGQSPPSSRSCPRDACTRLPLRQTGRCACGFGGNNVIMFDWNIKNFTPSLWFPCALCHRKLTILNTFGAFSVCQRSLLLQFLHVHGLLRTKTCATCWCVTQKTSYQWRWQVADTHSLDLYPHGKKELT